MFDCSQDAFVQLKNILAENSSPVYLWVGAGLSLSAGMPSWQQLRQNMVKRARKFIEFQEESKDRNSREIKIKLAESETDLWNAFEYIHSAVGDAEFDQSIVAEFASANTCLIPDGYKRLLELNVKGVVTTNIDRLITRTFYEVDRHEIPIEFNGYECSQYHHVLNSSRFFILHLHGFIENKSSWVLRRSDFDRLLSNEAYQRFIQTIFYERTIVFVGVNPMDEAVELHLQKVRRDRGSTPLFWVTTDTSDTALEFCSRYNIRRIIYSPEDGHRDLNELISLLKSGKSFDETIVRPGIYNLPTVRSTTRNLNPESLHALPLDDARDLLNKKALEILCNASGDSYKRYELFIKEYQQQIHNAWFVEQGSRLLGWLIKEKIGDGAFGRVFRAENADGDVCAIKLLKLDVMRKPECLQCFRRGVRAMQILNERDLKGVVKYRFSSEIPAFVAMEYIEGANLFDVVQAKRLNGWYDKMKVLVDTSGIIKSAHALPERVLHRDIRPQNVMLRGFDYESNNWNVCILDFDLAFHKGANEVSMQMASGVNGFLAPEQTSSTGKTNIRRNSRVDSYGFAMLSYFVISGKIPRPDQCRQEGWTKEIRDAISSCKCEEWVSLPYQLGEIIRKSTSVNQNERMDLYEIHNRLGALQGALCEPDSVRDPEMIANELLMRVATALRACERISRDISGNVTLDRLNGSLCKFTVVDRNIVVSLEWHSLGNVNFAKVHNALMEKAYALAGKFIRSGFRGAEHRSAVSGAIVEVPYSADKSSLERISTMTDLIVANDLSPKMY